MKSQKLKKRLFSPAVIVPNTAGTLEYWDNIQWQTFASQSYVNAVAVTSVSGTADQIEVSGTLTPVISLAPNVIFPGFESLTLPIGTTAQRPWPFFGMIRANSSTGRIEVGDGMFWNSINTSNASVSSIGITAGAGISVSGSPVTSSGNISVGLSNTGVWSGTYSYISSLTTNAQGQITAISSGSAPTGGTVTSITAGTGLSGGTITTSGTISLANTAVTSGIYAYPSSVSVNAQGQLTNITAGSAVITLSGAVTGSGTLGSTLETSLNSSQTINGNPLTFNWSNLGVLPGYQLTHLLAESSPANYFTEQVGIGSGGTYRGWQHVYSPGSSSVFNTSYSLQFYHPLTGMLVPFSITTFGGALISRFGTQLDMGNNKIFGLATPVNSTDASTKGYVDGKTWPYVSSVACTGSTGLSVSGSPITSSGTLSLTLGIELQALSGLNTTGLVARTGSASYAPRTLTAGTGISITNGDGIAGNPTLSVSSIDINSATTGQLNISRLNGYPTSSSSFLRGDGTWNQINLSSNVTGSLPINKLAGYPGTTTTFLRGDGTWVAPVTPSIDINSGTTGQLNISRLNGYPTNAGVYLNGNGTWTSPYLNALSINGNLSLSGFDLTNVGTIFCYTLSSPGTEITLGDHLIVGSKKIYGTSNGSYISHSNGTWFFTAGITQGLNKSYGYLNSGGNVGTASGTNFYSIVCHNRVAASEFNATSSQKIKRVSKEPMDIEDLRQKFLDISFKSYQYLDPSTGQGDHYGIIAEDLMEYFPQFVDAEHDLYIPNCLKLMTLTKIEGLTYFFTHDFDLSAIDPKSQKIKIVMGDSQVDTTIVTLTKQTLQVVIKEQDAERVKAEHHKNHYFAYGTYEKCPTVSKNKLFEVGLILLQDVLRERKRK